MKIKGLKIILIILVLLTGSMGVVGYMQSKKQQTNKPNEDINKITYEYYLEDELQEKMPINMPNATDENGNNIVSEPTYQFSRFTCTNETHSQNAYLPIYEHIGRLTWISEGQ